MTQSEDYRLYLEEKFNGLDTHFNVINDKLTKIEMQTTKTNGRVTQHDKDLESLKVQEITHIINCPNSPRIKVLEDDLSEYRFFKKYPKILAGIVIFIVISFGIVSYETYKKISVNERLNNELITTVDSLKSVK